MNNKPKVGISACLLGEKVRYNGESVRDLYLVNTLGQFFEYVPFCPEVSSGMSVPREPMRLVGEAQAPRLITRKTGLDLTDKLVNFVRKNIDKIEAQNLCAYIFKSKSPSCGAFRVKLYPDGKNPGKMIQGIWAKAVTEKYPLLPVEEEGRLHDPKLRENFIERVFVYMRWKEFLKNNPSRGGLVDFHTRHKFLLLAHSEKYYREMGKIVAKAKNFELGQVVKDYCSLLMKAMTLKTTKKKNVNVLMHILGYFKKHLTHAEKIEFLDIIDNYKNGFIPLIVPITLINHYARKYQIDYLLSQYYLNPHPIELGLRNHV